MPKHPHPKPSPQSPSEEHHERVTAASDSHTTTCLALQDMKGLLVAALCVVRMREEDFDTGKDGKRQALEALLEHGRGAVESAQEGLEGVWNITAKYLYGQQGEAPIPAKVSPISNKGRA